MSTNVLTLRVNCSSDISSTITKDKIENFTELLSQNAPGRGYQWSYIIPLLQPSTVPASPLTPTSSYSSTDGPYTGPGCCVTVPAPQDDQSWPHRVHTTVPTIFAELILMSGADTSEAELSQLKDFVFEAIKMYLCPVGQKVWVCVTGRKIAEEKHYKSEGVLNLSSK